MMKLFREFFYFSDVQREHSKYIKGIATASVLGLGLSFTACSDSTNTAGGGPSGTEAGNAITAQILTADKSPAALAKVKVIESASLDADKAYTATADKNGQVTIEGVAKGEYILEAKQGGNALQMNITVDEENLDLGSSNLEKTVSVSGNVDAEGTVKVRGLDYSAPVVDGKFQLDSLPAGHLDLVFIPKAADADTVSSYVLAEAGKKATANTFANESKSLLLDDFEDGDNQHRFAPMYFGPSDGGWWYVSHSKSVVVTEGSEFVKSAKGSEEVPQMTKDSDGNTALHLVFDYDSLKALDFDEDGERTGWPWANMGVAVGSNDKSICYDLTSATAIRFKAKGSGNLNFILVDEKNKTETFDGKFATSNFTLLEDWASLTIDFAGIVDERAGSLSCVTLIAWEVTGGKNTEVWIDDVELLDADRTSIWKTEPRNK